MKKAKLSAKLAAARVRLEELEAAEVERHRAEQMQDALYRIAETASAAQDMQEFYAAIHGIVGGLMYASNFYIALYDDGRQLINWPFYVDELDPDPPEPNVWEELGTGTATGTTAYVLRTGEPQLISYERHLELAEQGEIELVGVITEHIELARRSPQVRREDAGRPRGAELHRGRPLHGSGQGAADLRRPACRVSAAADAAAGRDAAACCRARADQQRAGGARRRARAAGHLRPRRRQAPRHLRRAGRRHRRLRRRGRSAALPLHDRARRPLSGRADAAGGLPAPRDGDARAADDQRGHRARGQAVRQSGR